MFTISWCPGFILQYVKVSNSNYFLHDDMYLHFRSEADLKLHAGCKMLGQTVQLSSSDQIKKADVNVCPLVSDF
jgi:hypothetical protein